MPSSADESPPPPVLPGYAVLGFLGCGATGAVWAVRGPDEVRLAAKVLPAGTDQLDYELSVLQSLRHEHVVRLHDVAVDVSAQPPATALIMDLAEGGSLADTLERREVLTPGELVTVLCPVARALHDLHGLGLVHGDLSPGNILLTGDGKPLIADLGMSRLAGHAGEEVWATEAWAAPEVLAGAGPVPASDVYSLGAIAWRALTGVRPEPAALRPDLAELAPQLSDELADLVNSALAHTDSARPLPGEFAIALWHCAKPEPAPVQGSPGRRTAVAAPPDTEADALTRRIREQAAADAGAGADTVPDRSRRRSWISPRSGSVLGVAALAGVVTALAATGWGFGASSDAPRPASASPTGSVRPTSGAAAAPETRSTLPASPAATAATATAHDPVTDKAAALATLGARPVPVVQRLVAARADAWASGDVERLAAAEVKGSPAYQRDSADLRTAAIRKVRYHGLRFTVRSATVGQRSGEVLHVRVVIDSSAYQVIGAGTRHTMPARSGQRTDLSMRWTNDGWRVVDWAAAG